MTKKFDLGKSFIIPGTPEDCRWHTVERSLYETMPAPMIAHTWPDEQMQQLADAIGREFDYEGTLKYWEDAGYKIEHIDDELDELWWRSMEDCAVQMGMRYYEDLDADEYERLTSK